MLQIVLFTVPYKTRSYFMIYLTNSFPLMTVIPTDTTPFRHDAVAALVFFIHKTGFRGGKTKCPNAMQGAMIYENANVQSIKLLHQIIR